MCSRNYFSQLPRFVARMSVLIMVASPMYAMKLKEHLQRARPLLALLPFSFGGCPILLHLESGACAMLVRGLHELARAQFGSTCLSCRLIALCEPSHVSLRDLALAYFCLTNYVLLSFRLCQCQSKTRFSDNPNLGLHQLRAAMPCHRKAWPGKSPASAQKILRGCANHAR